MNHISLQQKWKEYISSEFHFKTLQHVNIEWIANTSWIFPSITEEIIVDNKFHGYIFSYEDCKDISTTYLAKFGCIAVAGSSNGATLLLYMVGENEGSCVWLAPGWDHYEACNFRDITTELLGAPHLVIDDMIRLDFAYTDDLIYKGFSL